eukprot:jgi/Galph1/5868/GphlegSOOS_G4486.1
MVSCSGCFALLPNWSGRYFVLEKWLVKEQDQVRPFQVVAIVKALADGNDIVKESGQKTPLGHSVAPQNILNSSINENDNNEVLELVSLTDGTLLSKISDWGSQETTCGNFGLRTTAKLAGKVYNLFLPEKSRILSSQILLQVEKCDHKVQFNGNCAICGVELDNYLSSSVDNSPKDSFLKMDWTSGSKHLNPAYTHPQLRVSRNELELVEGENTWRLLKKKKLSLVLDLDNTLIHSTLLDCRYWHSREWYNNQNQEQVAEIKMGDSILRDIYEVELDGSISLVKLRPHVRCFLESIHQRYELHIYTMGSRPYADAVASLLDPQGTLFQCRIVSRDDFAEGMMNRKSLRRIFPCDDSMVVIVDDRDDVWMDQSSRNIVPNLIRAKPYLFFVQDDSNLMEDVHQNTFTMKRENEETNMAFSPSEGPEMFAEDNIVSEDQENRNQQSGPMSKYSLYLSLTEKAVENDENYLRRLQEILEQVHEQFFDTKKVEENDIEKDPFHWLSLKRDVKLILSQMRHMVLKSCYISFTGVFRLDEPVQVSWIWRLAEEFGATCSKEITSRTTHLIADSQRGLHTNKTKQAAQRGDIFLVTYEWLEACFQFYLRASELQYALFPEKLISKDLRKYRMHIENRHEKLLNDIVLEEDSCSSPHKPVIKRRKTDYSSSSSSSSAGSEEESEQVASATNSEVDEDMNKSISPKSCGDIDHVELEWTASFLASELEKELMSESLSLSHGNKA